MLNFDFDFELAKRIEKTEANQNIMKAMELDSINWQEFYNDDDMVIRSHADNEKPMYLSSTTYSNGYIYMTIEPIEGLTFSRVIPNKVDTKAFVNTVFTLLKEVLEN